MKQCSKEKLDKKDAGRSTDEDKFNERSSQSEELRQGSASPNNVPPASRPDQNAPLCSTSNSYQSAPAVSVVDTLKEANDFLSRAKAMGLQLTMEDYERARAGVSAFLRAERVKATCSEKSSAPTPDRTLQCQSSSSKDLLSTARNEDKMPPPSGKFLQRQSSQSSTAMLSFFTAVVPSHDEEKRRPRLEDVGSLAERRRKREKRRRLREKAEREASDADCEVGSHRRKHSMSEPADTSPSTAIGGADTPPLGSSDHPVSRTSSGVHKTSSSSTVDSMTTVGLGINSNSDQQSSQNGVPFSPIKLSRSLKTSQSPSLKRLGSKAFIDEEGHLALLATPTFVRDKETSYNEPVLGLGQFEDESIAATCTSGGMETDDSGVCLVSDAVPSKKDGDPSSRRNRVSSSDSSNAVLNEGMSNLTFLDRVMAQKKSPLRLRREAKAKERRERLAAANNDLIVMAASTSEAQPASSAPIGDAKSVRWAGDFSSPRKRMTTKELYDFELYGIAPGNHSALQGALGSWDNELEGGREYDALPRLRHGSSSAFLGSPMASRSSAVASSPSVAPLSTDDKFAVPTQVRRGLLFGQNNTLPTASTTSSLDGALGDISNVFSQGPTLARSPARKALDATETPPRFLRANTLATPISFSQLHNDDKDHSSPGRRTIQRANSTGLIDRSVLQHSLMNEADKENTVPASPFSSHHKKAPPGWAHCSPPNKHETISPAAIFGMHQAQQRQQRIRLQSFGSTTSENERNQTGFTLQNTHSDNEGDDERDDSPITRFKSRGPLKKTTGEQSDSHHSRNSSQSATSAFGDSPLLSNTHERQARIMSNPSSGSSLAWAMNLPESNTSCSLDKPGRGQHTDSSVSCTEWDKPDGSRVVRLISEELQAALESGTLSEELPARYYKLPPGWGKSSAKPQSVSYAGMIGQAILSSSDSRLSLNEIYNWISMVYPFFERGDRGWQNSIRHNLSLNKSFIKVEREPHIPGKGGLWAIKEGHESKFHGGNYYASGASKGQKDMHQKNSKTLEVTALDSTSHQSLRKRHEKEYGEETSDSDNAKGRHSNVEEGKVRPSKHKSKRLRHSSADVGHSVQNSQAESTHAGKVIQVGLLQPTLSQSTASTISHSHSPHDSSTITPSRPYYPQQAGTSSSELGSAYASSVLANVPMLTDASSPPSSPNGVMPPPARGLHGASNTHSAQKRRESSNAAMSYPSHPNINLPMYGSYGGLSQNMLQASPLASMRGNHPVSSQATNRLRPGAASSENNGSPLRRSVMTSPSRLIHHSPPVSSMRGDHSFSQTNQDESMRDELPNNNGVGRSPARFLNHSPLRGSPLRPGGPMHHLSSPAGLSMQMAIGSSTGVPNSSSHHTPAALLNFSHPPSTLNITPTSQRWNFASPLRRSDGSLCSPFATPSLHNQSSAGLDDPFDYSGNLQHELDLASEFGHFGAGAEQSPMKGFYTTNQDALSARPAMFPSHMDVREGHHMANQSHEVPK